MPKKLTGGTPRFFAALEDTTSTNSHPKKIAERVSVELGLMDDKVAEILSGIEEGDPIVVIGQSNLKDGASIRTREMLPPEPKEAADKKEADTEEAG